MWLAVLGEEAGTGESNSICKFFSREAFLQRINNICGATPCDRNLCGVTPSVVDIVVFNTFVIMLRFLLFDKVY